MGFSNHRNLLPMFLTFSIFYFDFGTCLDTITASQIIEDPATVSSNDSRFKLGFFSPENSTNRYVGIWYLSEANVVWIANRDQPLTNSSGIFTISEDGNFVVLNDKKKVIWSSNVSNIATNSTAQLLDSGNLVLIDHTGKTVWESFQHPCNAYIPKMILSTNKITGKKVKLTSWKSPSDPSIGNFSASLERLTIPEVIIWNHSQAYWRTGPWNRTVFLGIPNIYSPYLYGFSIGRDGDGTVHLTYASSKESVFFILALNSQGKFVRTTWNNKKVTGKLTIADTDSDVYGFCGAFGSSNLLSAPICCCLRGFEPRKTKEWSRQNWTSGCVRRESLQCERTANDSKGDGFVKLQMMKVPDFAEWSSASQDKCRTQCLGNCSCIAYVYDTGIGCMSWSGNLIDIQQFSGEGVDLYIRVAHSEFDKERNLTVIITVTVIVGTIIIAACACFLWRWTVKHSARKKESKQSLVINTRETSSESQSGNHIEDLEQIKLEELPLFDFRNIATATNNFSTENKLGKGGFGSVYKGELRNGQEIAVKRLSRASRQGLEEFMNEVVVISKLQHRNLVRILGCCIEEEEKILIYEYMPNKSLDAFIFDPVKRKVVDWKKRFNIIDGISQGLLYLHRDSRLKIIHRDLKPSNILLDGELNPKISDFGMARIFGDNQDAHNTKRIVGTYGYMSPEYAIEGLFSERSDVFSFGILLLEIISGSKNTSFYHDEESLSLVGFAWKLRNENNIISLIDPEISDPRFHKEILRCVDIGLLCVQEHARDRPTMATVISMLNSDIVNLPTPKQPTFILSETELMVEFSQTSDRNCSIHNVTVSDIQDR